MRLSTQLRPRWLTETFWGQIGFGGGCIAQLTVPGKGTVLNSHPSDSYGKKMHISNWRRYHIHGVVGEMWDGKQFVPRLTLPMSLTADHRVIDGALATRFNVYLAQLLSDFRRVML